MGTPLGMPQGAFRPGGPAASPVPKPPRRGRPAWLYAVVAAGALGLIGGGIALAVWLLSGPNAKLADKVPQNIMVYIELPDVGAMTEDLASMRFLEPGTFDLDEMRTKALGELKASFDVEQDVARGLLESVESIAVAFTGGKEPTPVLLVSFTDPAPVTELLKSSRFEELGKLGEAGVRYQIIPEKDPGDDPSGYRKAFADMDTNDDDVMVWFEAHGIIAIGEIDLVREVGEVLAGNAPSLEDSDRWDEAEFGGDGDLLIYVDQQQMDLGKEGHEFLLSYMHDVRPPTLTIDVMEAGFLSTLDFELRGDKIPIPKSVDSDKLDLHDRLPEETLAYFEMATFSEDIREDFAQKLIEKNEEEAKAAQVGLALAMSQLGVSVEEISAAIGPQLIMAVALPKDVTLSSDKEVEDYRDEGAFAVIIEVGDEDAARKLLDAGRKELRDNDKYAVVDAEGGFALEPRGDEPYVRVGIIEGTLVGLGGARPMVDRFVAALDGDDTLEDDEAHEEVIDAFESGAAVIAWMDAGRAGKFALEEARRDESESIEELEEDLGTSIDALILEGDKRIGLAMALHLDTTDDAWQIRVQGVNGPVLTGIGTAVFVLYLAKAFSDFGDELEKDSAELEQALEAPTPFDEPL